MLEIEQEAWSAAAMLRPAMAMASPLSTLKSALVGDLPADVAYSAGRSLAASYAVSPDAYDLAEVREVFATSAIASRLQTWPRGYPGDFETVEILCSGLPLAPPNSALAHFEAGCLALPIVNQHRNKLDAQAEFIRVQARGNCEFSVLSIGCGGARDLQAAAASLGSAHIFLNDIDTDALKLAETRLRTIAQRVEPVAGNALRVLMRFARDGEHFNAVVAGGLFDYLEDAVAMKLLLLISEVLTPNGRLFFTNIARDNPWRPWMERVLDWRLLHRSENELFSLLPDDLRAGAVIERDSTGLALLASCARSGR